MAPEETL
jgi:hypothetical protein